ncbi:MAG TPA: hypothetical protein VMT00_14615 [Thermoanaerobaculia bacterium]|nr:hypothetical protein [Thermoanaerobaculia bacterium]
MPATVHFLCKHCDWRLAASAAAPSPTCENCGSTYDVLPPDGSAPLAACAACGCAEMYAQKDFNRTTGLVLVVIGAIFVPWTWGLSLLAVTIIDVVLYRLLPEVGVCYACRAVHRGFPRSPDHREFDLVVHDRHVYGAAPPGAEEAHGGRH